MLNLGPLKVGNRTEILQTSTKGQFLIFFQMIFRFGRTFRSEREFFFLFISINILDTP